MFLKSCCSDGTLFAPPAPLDLPPGSITQATDPPVGESNIESSYSSCQLLNTDKTVYTKLTTCNLIVDSTGTNMQMCTHLPRKAELYRSPHMGKKKHDEHHEEEGAVMSTRE